MYGKTSSYPMSIITIMKTTIVVIIMTLIPSEIISSGL